MPQYKVRQSLVGDLFAWHTGEIIEWPDAEDAARLVEAGVLELVGPGGIVAENPPTIDETETPEATRAKSRKKETRG
jgi:hypothetical protein